MSDQINRINSGGAESNDMSPSNNSRNRKNISKSRDEGRSDS